MALNAKNLGIAGGVLWGVMIFLMTLASVQWGYGTAFLDVWVSVYPGYTITWVGSIIGLVYGFIDGFIALFVVGYVYNWLEK